MTAHIHRDCIIALAEDTTRTLQFWLAREPAGWFNCATHYWSPSKRYRVLDSDGNIIAETPAPKPRRVRIDASFLPAPLESIEGHDEGWLLDLAYSATTETPPKPFCRQSDWFRTRAGVMFWATEAEAQEWLDFLTADREVVSDE